MLFNMLGGETILVAREWARSQLVWGRLRGCFDSWQSKP